MINGDIRDPDVPDVRLRAPRPRGTSGRTNISILRREDVLRWCARVTIPLLSRRLSSSNGVKDVFVLPGIGNSAPPPESPHHLWGVGGHQIHVHEFHYDQSLRSHHTLYLTCTSKEDLEIPLASATRQTDSARKALDHHDRGWTVHYDITPTVCQVLPDSSSSPPCRRGSYNQPGFHRNNQTKGFKATRDASYPQRSPKCSFQYPRYTIVSRSE